MSKPHDWQATAESLWFAGHALAAQLRLAIVILEERSGAEAPLASNSLHHAWDSWDRARKRYDRAAKRVAT